MMLPMTRKNHLTNRERLSLSRLGGVALAISNGNARAVMTANKSAKTPWRPIFLGYLLCAVVTAIVLLFCLALVVTHVVDISFMSDAACQRAAGTKFYSSFTYCFYGSEWNESTYLSAVSGFYSTIIAVLVAVQALVSGIAFVFVRSTNRRAIEDEVEVQLPAYFQTIKAADMVEAVVRQVSSGAVERAVDQKTAELQDQLSDLEQNYYGLQSEYETLREVVAKLNGETGNEDDGDDGSGVIFE
ncbi:hypothetical protein [Loktanella salsilacus]|uniref:hypothetical protein n=1 Tax=Loktanella salsilacus TaxID=195913 RepID=UPI003703B9C2